MYEEILKKIRTKDEANKLIEEIDMLSDAFYRQALFPSTLDSKVRFWFAEILREKIKREKNFSLAGFLKNLKEKVEKLRVLSIVIAFEPTEVGLEKLASFVKENVGGDVILEIVYNPRVIAGAILIWGGKYKDFSLRRVFEEECDKKKEEIIELFKS